MLLWSNGTSAEYKQLGSEEDASPVLALPSLAAKLGGHPLQGSAGVSSIPFL